MDADLSGYFDSIPHAELMKSMARRVSDRELLRLVRRWLRMPIEQADDHGHKQRRNPAKRTGRGSPQGASISPLLAKL